MCRARKHHLWGVLVLGAPFQECKPPNMSLAPLQKHPSWVFLCSTPLTEHENTQHWCFCAWRPCSFTFFICVFSATSMYMYTFNLSLWKHACELPCNAVCIVSIFFCSIYANLSIQQHVGGGKIPFSDWQFPFWDEFDHFWGGEPKVLKKIYIPRVIFNIPSPPWFAKRLALSHVRQIKTKQPLM